MKRTRTLPAIAATALAVVILTLPGVAGATTGQADDELGPRLERACHRIPNLELRTTNFLDRLRGDAAVKGSLAWLQDRIDEADEAGRDQLVTVLENRLEVRTTTIDVLEARQEALADARQLCLDHGVEP